MRPKVDHILPVFGNSRSDHILRLQSRLLKELPLSLDTEKSYRNQVKNILSAAAEVIDLFFLYAFSEGVNGKREIEIFWLREPFSLTRNAVALMFEQSIGEDHLRSKISFCDSTADTSASLPELAAQNITLHARIIQTDTPMENVITGMGLATECRCLTKDDIVIENVLTAFSNILTAVMTLSAYRREMERFATRDPLTNLYNRVSFWDLLEYENSRSQRQKYKLSLLVVDLDNFKAIDDIYGHDTGDSFLRDFSVILKGSIRSGDIAARYAGGQFAAILPVCDESQAFM